MSVRQGNKIIAGGIGKSGTIDYTELENKPSINDIVLEGNKTLDDLGIQPVGEYATKTEVDACAKQENTYTKDEVDQKIAEKDSLPEQSENTYGMFLQSGTPSAKWSSVAIIKDWEE